MSIIAFVVIGFLAGLLARAIVPGRQHMGLVATTLLGMVGSLVGGLIGGLFSPREPFALRPTGIILSIVGSIVVLLIAEWIGGSRRRLRV